MLNLAQMASIYASAMPHTRAWSADEIANLCRDPGFCVTAAQGFALGQIAAGEAELITLVVAPGAQRRGQGRALLEDFTKTARARGADTAFLEVDERNIPAIALYQRAGWHRISRRPDYYSLPNAEKSAALIFRLDLNAV